MSYSFDRDLLWMTRVFVSSCKFFVGQVCIIFFPFLSDIELNWLIMILVTTCTSECLSKCLLNLLSLAIFCFLLVLFFCFVYLRLGFKQSCFSIGVIFIFNPPSVWHCKSVFKLSQKCLDLDFFFYQIWFVFTMYKHLWPDWRDREVNFTSGILEVL